MFTANRKMDLAVAQIPKSGITSIRDWLRPDFEPVTPDEAKSFGRRVAFIRHPLSRVKSAYQFLYWMRQRGAENKSGIPVDSWHSFVDYVLDPEIEDNEHWRPQVEFTGDAPNIWHKFENIDQHWEKYCPGILNRENASSKLDTDDYRKDELLMKYADDLRLWERAT